MCYFVVTLLFDVQSSSAIYRWKYLGEHSIFCEGFFFLRERGDLRLHFDKSQPRSHGTARTGNACPSIALACPEQIQLKRYSF